ncbi:hypothetical protein ABW20_dc0110214 [Dactylellina cionopaga]|nr:hypothetical protein ABW20_dc0110214 [Dactylellina cionopaga]
MCLDSPKLNRLYDAGKPLKQYNQNVALKINLKSGGINQSTAADDNLKAIFPNYDKNEVMLAGADVSHSGSRHLPSITAVVASYETSHSRLYADIGFQTNKELIDNLQQAFEARLKYFYEKNKRLPGSIIMFRDGVSESQYKQVMSNEIPKIERAIASIVREKKGSEKPTLTVIVVGKRHQTRFFPLDTETTRNGANNTSPGLVVDRGVTAIYEKDFFLQAHSAIRGTARPAHYFVVKDEKDLTDTQIQQLAHIWSHSFGRSMRSVSYAPPAYCADLACGRARAWIQKAVDGIRGTGMSSDSGTDDSEIADRNLRSIMSDNPYLHPNLENTMWYI